MLFQADSELQILPDAAETIWMIVPTIVVLALVALLAWVIVRAVRRGARLAVAGQNIVDARPCRAWAAHC